MEKVLKLKEIQIRKKIKNNALRNGIIGFIVVTLFSLLSSSTIGEIFSRGMFYGFFGFIVIYAIENFNWSKLKKKYLSYKYSVLEDLGFELNEHLYFEGEHNGYYLNIIPFESKTKEGKTNYFDIIQVFYHSKEIIEKIEEPLVLKYYIGYLFFFNECVLKTYLNDNMIDFKNDLDYITSVLIREEYVSISKDELFNDIEE